MLSLRAYISGLINSEEASGEDIYQCLYEITDKPGMDPVVEEKAESLMDALSGWCSPDYYLGEGNYGQHEAA